jgi:hypothetical protein
MAVGGEPAAGSTSPDALGVVRNLPCGVAGTALHPPMVPACALPDLQDDPEHGGIGRGGELALPALRPVTPPVATGLRVERVGPNSGPLAKCT